MTRIARRAGGLFATLLSVTAMLLMLAGVAQAVTTQYMTYANGRCAHIPVYGYALPEGSVYYDYAAGGTLTQPRVVVNNTPNGVVFHLGQRATTSSPWVNWGDAIWIHPFTSYQLSAAAFPYKHHELWVLNFYVDAHSGRKIGYCHGYSV